MVRMLNRYRTELGVEALPAELEATARATIRQLQEETATVGVSAPRLDGGHGSRSMSTVRNLSGHKFPTGYPSRRTWLHVTVRDSQGGAVFESGAIDEAGAIAGNDNDADPVTFEPHYEEITRADQVQIYEPILGDPRGRADDGPADGHPVPQGQPAAAARIRQGDGAAEIGVYGGAARRRGFHR